MRFFCCWSERWLTLSDEWTEKIGRFHKKVRFVVGVTKHNRKWREPTYELLNTYVNVTSQTKRIHSTSKFIRRSKETSAISDWKKSFVKINQLKSAESGVSKFPDVITGFLAVHILIIVRLKSTTLFIQFVKSHKC